MNEVFTWATMLLKQGTEILGCIAPMFCANDNITFFLKQLEAKKSFFCN